jgi:hypothetical protein
MKKSGLTIFLVILVLILLLLCGWLFWRCHNGPPLPGAGCRALGEAKCEVELKLGQPGVSVWPDGTVAIAAAVENDGLLAAGNVRVTAIGLGASPRVAPAVLPAALGELGFTQRAVVQAQFKPVAVPGAYALTVSGTYEDRGATKSFTASWPVKLAAQATGPFKSIPVSVPVHHSGPKPLPASPVQVPPLEINPVGPPVPQGPAQTPFPGVSPQGTPIGSGAASGSSIVITKNTAGSYGFSNVPPDPDGAAAPAANVVMQTDNSFLNLSVDGGTSFTQVDPTTIFPQTDGGLCCDQVTIYDPQHNLIFWLLQYNSGGSPSANLLRVAWATPEAIKANVNSAWTWIDLSQSLLNSGGGLDYPDLAISGGYIYVSVDGSDSTGASGGLIVSRWSLSDIAGGKATINGAYFGVNESSDQSRAHGSHLAQNAGDGAYWGGHVDSSHLEVFHWPDSSGFVSTKTTGINSWCTSSSAYANLAPDGQQWPDTGHLGGDGNITGVVRTAGTSGGHGKVWLGWTAGRDASGCSQSGRPMPFVKIVQVDDQTLGSVGEYHIWNSPYAFGYVALASDPAGDVGVSVAYGGPSDYPSSTVGYLGDYVVYYVEQSNLSLRFYQSTAGYFTFDSTDPTLVTDSGGHPETFTRYGDYFTVRNAGSDGTQFTSQGYSVVAVDATKSTSCLTAPGCTFHTRYEVWGRPPVKIQ